MDVLAHWGIGIVLGYGVGELLGWQAVGLWWCLALGQLVAAVVLTRRFQQLIATRIFNKSLLKSKNQPVN